MSTSFKIVQVSWLTQAPGNEARREEIIWHIYNFNKFLEDNSLKYKNERTKIAKIDDYFSISSDDLTPEGLHLVKSCYDKWLQKVDNGMSPEDTTFLTKALQKIRAN